MKGKFEKVKLNRKSSAKSNSARESEPQQEDKTAKFNQLRAKVEKQREVMRQSGKRFNKGSIGYESSSKIQTKQSLKKVEKTENSVFAKKENKVAEVCIGVEPPKKIEEQKPLVKETIDLTSLIVEEKEVSMTSSRLFEKQLSQQKDRNKEVVDFLSEIGLSQFSEGLINLGYDELDVLMEVSCQELNFLMMRASQQRVLSAAFKEYKQKNGLSHEKAMDSSFSKTSSQFHVQVKNEAIREKKFEKNEKEVFQLARPKSAFTIASTTPTNNSGLFSNSSNVKPNPSFFIGIGGQDWSVDSLIRRACSTCFKVFPGGQMIEEQGQYMCVGCKKIEDDPLSINMNSSMIRDYKL